MMMGCLERAWVREPQHAGSSEEPRRSQLERICLPTNPPKPACCALRTGLAKWNREDRSLVRRKRLRVAFDPTCARVQTPIRSDSRLAVAWPIELHRDSVVQMPSQRLGWSYSYPSTLGVLRLICRTRLSIEVADTSKDLAASPVSTIAGAQVPATGGRSDHRAMAMCKNRTDSMPSLPGRCPT